MSDPDSDRYSAPKNVRTAKPVKPKKVFRLVHRATGQPVMNVTVAAYTKGEARSLFKETGQFGGRVPASMLVLEVTTG